MQAILQRQQRGQPVGKDEDTKQPTPPSGPASRGGVLRGGGLAGLNNDADVDAEAEAAYATSHDASSKRKGADRPGNHPPAERMAGWFSDRMSANGRLPKAKKKGSASTDDVVPSSVYNGAPDSNQADLDVAGGGKWLLPDRIAVEPVANRVRFDHAAQHQQALAKAKVRCGWTLVVVAWLVVGGMGWQFHRPPLAGPTQTGVSQMASERHASVNQTDWPRANAKHPGAGPTEARPSNPPTWTRRLNVNTATAGELALLPRIGPVLAAAIVAEREARGPYPSLEALQTIHGIGPKTLAELTEHAWAGPVELATPAASQADAFETAKLPQARNTAAVSNQQAASGQPSADGVSSLAWTTPASTER